MRAGPSKASELLVALLVPPACREEVVGDLHERYQSPVQYAWEVMRTVPLVIASRIRRTADPHVLLVQALTLYLSFLLATWLVDRPFLREEWGPVRLCVPLGAVLLGLILEDAYADPAVDRRRAAVRGPILGLTLAWFLETIWQFGKSNLAIPVLILLWGSAAALPLSWTVRVLFPPLPGQLKGVNAPADWLKQASEPVGKPAAAIVFVVLVVVYVALRSLK
jgi:hypothetical protein